MKEHKGIDENKRGFSLVELLVVIVIISILAIAGIVSFGRVQADARDQKRQSNASIISEALEKYYVKNGEYPSVASIADQSVATVKAKLGVVDTDVLIFPQAPTGANTSITGNPDLASKDKVAYIASSANTSEVSQCQTSLTGGCDRFTLQWIAETGEAQQITSRKSGRDTTLQPPTKPVITGSLVGSSVRATITTPSTCAAGTVQYKIIINNTDVAPDWSTVPSWSTSTTKDFSSAVAGTNYYLYAIAECVQGTSGEAVNNDAATDEYYYAAPGTASTTASWSGVDTIASATVSPVCTSGLTAKYYIEYKIDTASAGTWIVGVNWTTASSYTLANAAASNPRKFSFRSTVRCDNGGTPGTPSSVSNVAVLISAPAAAAVSQSSSSSSTTWAWPAVSCPVGTSPVYTGFNTGNYTSYPALPATMTSGYTITSNSKGFTYGLRIVTSCGTVSAKTLSVTSNDSTYLRPIDTTIYVYTGSIRTYRPNNDSSHTTWIFGQGQISSSSNTATGGSGGCDAGLVREVFFSQDFNEGGSDWSSWYGPYTWANGSIRTFVGSQTSANDRDANTTFEMKFATRCLNETTGQRGPTSYTDNFGNLRMYNSTGSFHTLCDQNVDRPYCQGNGYGYNEAGDATGTCYIDSGGSHHYCFSKNYGPNSTYVWGWQY